MTVYSFACSTPDDWSNWHFWAKTFGPGFFAACIALMAYRVANTQKKIATNKYNLDMFDKRWSVFESYHDIINQISKCNHGDHINLKGLESLEDVLVKCILKSEKLFESLDDNHVIAEYAIFLGKERDIMKNIPDIRREIHELDVKIFQFNIQNNTKEENEHQKIQHSLYDKITAISKEAVDVFEDIGHTLMSVYNKMDNELTVPHKPYEDLHSKIKKTMKHKST